MIGTVVRLTHTHTVRQWEFPPSRFVSYGKSDEAWARPLGFGKEVLVEKTITIPQALCVGIENHQYQFRALDSGASISVQI